jgi:hypothetical protein
MSIWHWQDQQISAIKISYIHINKLHNFSLWHALCSERGFVIGRGVTAAPDAAHPSLEGIKVELVDELPSSNRGTGGFGSTGK